MQELDGLLAITGTLVPEPTLASQKIIGAGCLLGAVNAIRQPWAITRTPSGLAHGRPGITQVAQV